MRPGESGTASEADWHLRRDRQGWVSVGQIPRVRPLTCGAVRPTCPPWVGEIRRGGNAVLVRRTGDRSSRTAPLVPLRKRITRWIGADRNPLRRPIDRFENVVRVVLVLAFLTGAPMLAPAAWHLAEVAGVQQVQREASWRQVAGRLVADGTAAVLRLREAGDVLGAWQVARAVGRGQAGHGPGQGGRGSGRAGQNLGRLGWSGHEPASDDDRDGQGQVGADRVRQRRRAGGRSPAAGRPGEADVQPAPDADLGHRVGMLRPALEHQALAA